jgi:serine/threonine protein kinase
MMSEDFPAQLTWFRQGSLLAGYRLEAQVGAGGMAVVFRARDERLGRLVALKILAPALRADSEFRRRFMAESRAAAADDPNIIPIYEAGFLSVTHRSSSDHAVALTPDSRRLATSSPDHSVRIWGTADGQALMTISVDPNSR